MLNILKANLFKSIYGNLINNSEDSINIWGKFETLFI